MRPAFSLGRLCLRQKPQRLLGALARHERIHYSSGTRWQFPRSPPKSVLGYRVIIGSAVLSPAAFVALSEEDDGDGKTPEEHMLEASRAEIAKELPDDIRGIKRVWKEFWLGVDYYIIEPVMTCIRFLHLAIIFVPVIVTTPLVLLGPRRKERDNEHAGALWWYALLVHAMERGGPAFIKVETPKREDHGTEADLCECSSANGLPRDRTSFLRRCAVQCPPCTPMLRLIL